MMLWMNQSLIVGEHNDLLRLSCDLGVASGHKSRLQKPGDHLFLCEGLERWSCYQGRVTPQLVVRNVSSIVTPGIGQQ